MENKSQNARIRALEDFKAGDVKVLVATDIASRGIDVDDVGVVFNYDLPNLSRKLCASHRSNRTSWGIGSSVAFCTADEVEYLVDIEKPQVNRFQMTEPMRGITILHWRGLW